MSRIAIVREPDPVVWPPQPFLVCPDPCDESRWCACGAQICVDHSDDATPCAEQPDRLHHPECADVCGGCRTAAAGDAAADHAEDVWRGDP